jgi:HlyD family secretion protein
VHAILYVSASVAGKIQTGQFARVSPVDVNVEEYGFILGRVGRIASDPASTADMSEKLKNDSLVKEFTSAGPVFEVRICLETDATPGRPTPFKWSSSQGPPTRTQAGTVCTASIVVAELKPYTLVIPALRRKFGL